MDTTMRTIIFFSWIAFAFLMGIITSYIANWRFRESNKGVSENLQHHVDVKNHYMFWLLAPIWYPPVFVYMLLKSIFKLSKKDIVMFFIETTKALFTPVE